MPSIEYDVVSWGACGLQDQEQCPDADRFDRDEKQLDRRHSFAETGGHEKQHLRDRRVDCRRVVVAVDIRKDGFVAQRCEIGVGRNVAIRIDSGSLNTPIPNVAVDVVGKINRSR